MDVLRKELNEFYASQHLEDERLDYEVLAECKGLVKTVVDVENDCRVITDAAADTCHIVGGAFSHIIGISETDNYIIDVESSDEDIIYIRIHPEDLVDKRMLEYEFFKFVDSLPDAAKLQYKATCRLRMRNQAGKYVSVSNSTRVMRLSPAGNVWLILCTYTLALDQKIDEGIDPCIINFSTGEIIRPQLTEQRGKILTSREKEILRLIKEGKLSKQIAADLGISIHTVNRHRQNILEKLSVGNSVEALMAATAMRLL